MVIMAIFCQSWPFMSNKSVANQQNVKNLDMEYGKFVLVFKISQFKSAKRLTKIVVKYYPNLLKGLGLNSDRDKEKSKYLWLKVNEKNIFDNK